MDFASARLESIRINKYRIKHLKNKVSRDLIFEFLKSKGELTEKLRLLIAKYEMLKKGILSNDFSDSELGKITSEQLNKIYEEITSNANLNFMRFYDSYMRKIDLKYNQEIIDNSLNDLKIAYSTYRKCQNPSWNLTEGQITESEMKNLYNILSQNKIKEQSEQKKDDNIR